MADSNRARLLAYSRSLAAAMSTRMSSSTESSGATAAAPALQCDSTATAEPAQLSRSRSHLSAADATDAGAAKTGSVSRPPSHCRSSSADSAGGTAPELHCGAHPEELAAPVSKAAQHQPQRQDEPPAPQTPQKAAPTRPRSAQPQPAPDLQLTLQASTSERVVCSHDAASSNVQAAAAVQPADAAAMHPAARTEHTIAPARHPPIGEAEAVALVASCALAATAAERSAAGPLPWPLYFIATRDCFTFELAALTKQVRTPAG